MTSSANIEQCQDELDKVLFSLQGEKLTEVASYLNITVTDKSKRQIRQLIGNTIDINISKFETDDEKLKEVGQLFTLATGKPPPLIGTEIDLEEANLDQPKLSESLSESVQKETELEQLIKKHEVEMKWAKEKLVLLKEGSIKPKLVNIGEEKPEKTVITAAELTNSVLRREFRVFGQIGEPGQADKLSFVSLANQIGAAIRRGYSQREIVDGVIRAVAPGTHLRSYLESFKDLSLPQLQELLRNHYRERDTTAAYQDLSALSQELKETPQAFLMRALDARQKVLLANEMESSLKYDAELAQGMFLKVLETRLIDDNIASKMALILKRPGISDQEIMGELNEIVRGESQRQMKLKTKQKSSSKVTAASANVESNISNKKQTSQKTSDVQKSVASGEDKILAAIEAMKVELRAEMKAEIAAVKKSVSLDDKTPQFKSGQPSNYFDSHQARPRQASFVKRGCNPCRQAGKAEECEHCYQCGSVDHFYKGCKNKGNPQRLHLRDKV